MKFPFISRSVYDDVVGDLRRQLRDEQTRSLTLTRVAISMRLHRDGTLPRKQDAARQETNESRQQSNAVDLALDENKHTRVNPVLRARLRKWADRQFEAGAKQEDVLAKLSSWSIVNRDDDDDDDDDTIAVGVG